MLPIVLISISSLARRLTRAPGGDVAGSVAFVGVCLLIATLPFEALQPLVRLPFQSLSTAEAVLGVVLAAWIVTTLWTRATPRWRTPLTWPWIAFVAAMLLAALNAPEHQQNALSMVGRLAMAFAVFLMAINAGDSLRRMPAIVTVAAASGAMLSLIVIADAFGTPFASTLLEPFRTRGAVVGQYARASGPFQYPTIASMYLEVLFALGLALIPRAVDERRLGMLGAAALALTLVAAAVVTTLTRGGLVTLTTSLLIVGVMRWRQRGFDRAVQVLAAIAAAVLVLLVTLPPMESIRLRMTTEHVDTWFRARITAPESFAMRPGGRETIPVTVTNTGRSTWGSAVRLSYHWMPTRENRIVSWGGIRTPLPQAVSTGASVTVAAQVEAPGDPGDYRLLWDLQQGDRVWLSTQPDAPRVFTQVAVDGLPAGPGAPIMERPMPRSAVRPGRWDLWRAAVRMTAERPLTGVGPDNFRLVYGPYIGLDTFSHRTHSNSMYLEVLAGGGLIGTVAFVWLIAAAGRTLAAAGHAVSQAPVAGVIAAVFAIAIHGLVDSFLSFTATYVLFAIVLAMLVNASRVAAGQDLLTSGTAQ